MTRPLLTLVLAILSGTSPASADAATDGRGWWSPSSDSAAVAVAEVWLSYLDAGDYTTAWERAGSFARANFPLPAWRSAMTAARERLGLLEARRLIEVARESALPGAPPGEYVVLTYESRFRAWPSVGEQVTLMREEDGSWGILGYVVSGTG